MNPLRWIERKLFLRGSVREFPTINSNGTRFGCTLQLHKLDSSKRPIARLRVHQVSDLNFFDLSQDAARQLRDQLSELLSTGEGIAEQDKD